MEGLLPLVYRAIKKRKTRRQYHCLSSGAALMNVPEFYPQTQGHGYYVQEPSTNSMQKVVDHHAENIGYLRYNSAREFSNGLSSPQQRTCAARSPASDQLVRFRSQKLFSCLAG
ncbi:uncharacterized protein LOC109813661 [Cajanus cajan]|uniref:Uncharacterized protein n=1 Tax=Cajanus cajan TaxID=3821 RepID=A0A151S2F6_CAJCA|nr:uncharacterized protein LOC109813661 [Cajanus cajan]KYP48982.1 hypothetical protein KK1_029282 [Cajanus cajan]